MFTFLITDVFLYMIVIALGCYVYYVRNNYDLSKNWKLVFKKTTGVISIVFLTFFIFIALIDSIHFKTKMWNEQENEYVGLWNSLNFVKLREGFLQYLPFGALLGIVLIIELGILFLTRSFSENSLSKFVESPVMNEVENTKLIGQVLYTNYFYLFQISGLILLVAMVGSITLTLRDRGQVKRQNISQQNYLDANDSIEKKKIKLGEGI